jgi:hypothetical protein
VLRSNAALAGSTALVNGGASIVSGLPEVAQLAFVN